MKSIFLFIGFLPAIAVVFSCNAQPPKTGESLDAFINSRADSLYKNQKVPGIFIGISDSGSRHYYSFGFADPDKKLPFDSATVFEIGSITKTFTAYILEMVLKEKGISDTSSILPYLPDSVQTNTALKNVSFLSLLNHTSGLPRLPGNMDLLSNTMAPYDNYTSAHLFAYLKKSNPKPDGKSNYSNLGAGLAGVLAERISGKSYTTLLDEYIFSPFKITRHPDKSIPQIPNKGQGYFENNKSVYWKMDILAPAGGLKCSAAEMLRYLQAMINPPGNEAKQLINKLLEPTVIITPLVKVCRAWHTIEEKDKPVTYWHNGGTYGFSTFGAFNREKNKAVIVVVNQFNKNNISDGIGMAIMKKMIE